MSNSHENLRESLTKHQQQEPSSPSPTERRHFHVTAALEKLNDKRETIWGCSFQHSALIFPSYFGVCVATSAQLHRLSSAMSSEVDYHMEPQTYDQTGP
jgi:hypothetical protein